MLKNFRPGSTLRVSANAANVATIMASVAVVTDTNSETSIERIKVSFIALNRKAYPSNVNPLTMREIPSRCSAVLSERDAEMTMRKGTRKTSDNNTMRNPFTTSNTRTFFLFIFIFFAAVFIRYLSGRLFWRPCWK